MYKYRFYVAKMIKGREVLLFEKPNFDNAIGWASRWKEKGYYAVVKKIKKKR